MVSLFTVGITEFQNMTANSPRKEKKCFNKSHLKSSSDIPHCEYLTTGIKKGSLLPGFYYDAKYLPNTALYSSEIPPSTRKKNPSVKFPFLDKPAALRWVLHEHVLALRALNFECNNLFNHNLTLLIPV